MHLTSPSTSVAVSLCSLLYFLFCGYPVALQPGLQFNTFEITHFPHRLVMGDKLLHRKFIEIRFTYPHIFGCFFCCQHLFCCVDNVCRYHVGQFLHFLVHFLALLGLILSRQMMLILIAIDFIHQVFGFFLYDKDKRKTIEKQIVHIVISGSVSNASFFNLSTARTYISVNFKVLCPNRLLTVFMLAPLLNNNVAKLCRPASTLYLKECGKCNHPKHLWTSFR